MGDSVLLEAERLVHGDRQKAYGHPFRDFSRTAKMWSAVLGTEVSPSKVALCMICVKISRECNQHKRDNLVDIAGYAEADEMVEDFIAEWADQVSEKEPMLKPKQMKPVRRAKQR